MSLWGLSLAYKFFLSLIDLAFGSFANVLIHRIPKEEAISHPGSHCPDCGYKIPWYENLPLISFLILQGKCKNCTQNISWQYPLVELAVFLLAMFFINRSSEAATIMLQVDSSLLQQYLDQAVILLDFLYKIFLITLAVSLAIIDARHKTLPHVLTFSGIIVSIVFITIFGSSWYPSIELPNLIPELLSGFITALVQLGATLFTLDALTHYLNLIYFRQDALPVISSAITLRSKTLEKNLNIWYFALITVSILISSIFGLTILRLAFFLLGLLYLVNEIILDFFLGKAEETTMPETLAEKRTVFGGGDAAMLAMIAVSLGIQNAVLVLFASFYLLFIYILFFFVVGYFQSKFDDSASAQAYLKRNIPLGPTLAFVFIAAMMIL